jgi:hypothetical protein
VVVKNDKGEAGDVFVDYKVSEKEAYNTDKELIRIVQQRTRMNASRLVNMGSSALAASRTLNISRNLGEYSVRLPLPKKDRVSMVNHNTKIFIPTERRFNSYQDKPSNIVSYLQEGSSLDLRDGHAKRYYRGASIGRGNKLDFTSLQR